MNIPIRNISQGQFETWCSREDAPRGGYIGDCLSYSYLAKYSPETNAVYPVLTLGLSWCRGNAEFVKPILDTLRPALERFGCERRDWWADDGHSYEIWSYHAYSAHDIVVKLQSAARFLGWKQVGTGWWPKDYWKGD